MGYLGIPLLNRSRVGRPGAIYELINFMLSLLPNEDAEIVWRWYVENWTAPDIADPYEISSNGVRKRCRRRLSWLTHRYEWLTRDVLGSLLPSESTEIQRTKSELGERFGEADPWVVGLGGRCIRGFDIEVAAEGIKIRSKGY